MTLSTVEHWLTFHVRSCLKSKFHITTLRKVAFVIALISCVASGLVTIISLFTEPWRQHKHFTSLQINLISSAVNLGGYLTPPLLGILSDSHGPVILSWMAVLGFVPSYAYSSYAFDHPGAHFAFTLVAFAAIGVATSALFFSGLLTCAKLYPRYKFLSISCPTTFYGLSSLLASEVLKHPWFSRTYDHLDLGRVFRSFAWFYAVVGTLTWVSTSIVAMLKEPVEQEEHEPLLPTDSRVPPAQDYVERMRRFVRDPSAYLMMLAFFLTIGALEMFLANMGSLAALVAPNNRDIQARVLSYYALCSTLTRLCVGLLADFFTKYNLSRMWILYGMLLIGLISQILVPNIGRSKALVTLSSALSGTAYGGLFTIFPTLTLSVWGDAVFGTAYGCFMVAPAIGSTVYGIVYARIYDTQCSVENPSSTCIRPAFYVTSISFFVALLTSITIYVGFWKRRAVEI
ncbi:putative transporter MCH1 [Lachancea thermotolerans]|uniref:Probable transporter MCH1 n=1 Tax=Lachancea thermotolerans (strain ATCC 56472 / CBS 6340 / NRRL Y-8284) TaxID=559295 RepID=C5DFB9_LACTC|nr:KLTH0D13838p [Lachancea thermotolerans CBS 6340]CAR22874.1 KLTH0D13838p [Lachancea thermotolerans CBS 6340]